MTKILRTDRKAFGTVFIALTLPQLKYQLWSITYGHGNFKHYWVFQSITLFSFRCEYYMVDCNKFCFVHRKRFSCKSFERQESLVIFQSDFFVFKFKNDKQMKVCERKNCAQIYRLYVRTRFKCSAQIASFVEWIQTEAQKLLLCVTQTIGGSKSLRISQIRLRRVHQISLSLSVSVCHGAFFV